MKTKWLLGGLFVLFALASTSASAGNALLVKDGQPQAVIITAAEPPSLVKLAAVELQRYIEAISGARLPIETQDTSTYPYKIYVGESAATLRLGITADELKYGAFHVKSGPDYLVLLGDDLDFEPHGPWARNNGDRDRAAKEWDEMSGGTWGNPYGNLFRFYHRDTDVWFHDEGGSFNAVCWFLESLGVRWYMPGELGEVVPHLKSIPLPQVDETIRPDFAVRRWFGAYFAYAPETMLWERRLGMNSGYQVLGAGMHVHGMRLIHGRKEMQEAHPEYYAVYGGQRDTGFRGTGHACFTSDGLVQETVNFARAIFDNLDEPAVSLWPQDGFRQCQEGECLEMTASDNVWQFVDRVARELYKTHPDRWVTCGAYGSYRPAPDGVDQFSPNVLIFLSHPRPGLDDDENWETQQQLVESWVEKLGPGRLITNSNHLGEMMVSPRAYARDLQSKKGVFIGDWNEVRVARRDGTQHVYWRTPGLDHLHSYANARLLWDADLDIDALLDEYYTLFYGPASEQMKATWEFAEENYTRRGRSRFSLANKIQFLDMLLAAQAVAGDSIYGQRINAIINDLPPRPKLVQALEEETIARMRPNAPVVIGRDADSATVAENYTLVDLMTGDAVEIETRFNVTWDDDALVFDFHCDDPDMENLFISRDIWGGDSVAILLESPNHSYYQIEINPDGELFDADREYGRVAANWSSHAEVETERGPDFWRVVVRIPIVGEAEGALDPHNFVVGEKPAADNPWFFNVGRVRIRDFEKSGHSFSPTGSNYHDTQRFGRLEIH